MLLQQQQQWLYSLLSWLWSCYYRSYHDYKCIDSHPTPTHYEQNCSSDFVYDTNNNNNYTATVDGSLHLHYLSHLSTSATTTTTTTITTLLMQMWLVVEVLFMFYFYLVLVPKANQPVRNVIYTTKNMEDKIVSTTRDQQQKQQQQYSKSSSTTSNTKVIKETKAKKMNPYREPYHIHKHLLLRRILYRMLNDNCRKNDDTCYSSIRRDDDNDSLSIHPKYDPILVQQVMTNFVLSWFHIHPATNTMTSTSTTTTTTTNSKRSRHTNNTIMKMLSSKQSCQQRQQQQHRPMILPSCCASSISEISIDSTTTTTSSSSLSYSLSSKATATTKSQPLSNNSCCHSSSDDEIEELSVSSSEEQQNMPTIVVSSSSSKATTTTTTTTTNIETFLSSEKIHQQLKVLPQEQQQQQQQQQQQKYWTIPYNITKQNGMNDFLAWSMFNKHMKEMTAIDLIELEKCYMELQTITSLMIPDENEDDINNHNLRNNMNRSDHDISNDRNTCSDREKRETITTTTTIHHSQTIKETYPSNEMKSKRLSLEYVNAWHRPLLLYGIIYLIRTVLTKFILQYCLQFKRVQSSNNVTGWYRGTSSCCPLVSTPETNDNNHHIPIIFFHGIAPGGVFFYIPMLLFGKNSILSTINNNKNRSILLIDNMNISLSSVFMFDALSEQDMIQGIEELVYTYIPNPTTTPLAVCGHSFGSCIVSWLLNHSTSKLKEQIQLVVLLDPVTILLSEPNVMNNFLYSYKILSCIGMVASSELFTEYYLRHHFAWYNSELWLDEILLDDSKQQKKQQQQQQPTSAFTNIESGCGRSPKSMNTPYMIIALSEKDEIVDAPKVKRHIDLFHQRHLNNKNNNRNDKDDNYYQEEQKLRTIYWRNVGHADCLRDTNKWYDVQQQILDCENCIIQNGK